VKCDDVRWRSIDGDGRQVKETNGCSDFFKKAWMPLLLIVVITQNGGVVGVGVIGLDRDHAVAVQFEPVSGARLVDHRTVRDEAGKIDVPSLYPALGGLSVLPSYLVSVV
jgi:hypothetical protein